MVMGETVRADKRRGREPLVVVCGVGCSPLIFNRVHRPARQSRRRDVPQAVERVRFSLVASDAPFVTSALAAEQDARFQLATAKWGGGLVIPNETFVMTSTE